MVLWDIGTCIIPLAGVDEAVVSLPATPLQTEDR